MIATIVDMVMRRHGIAALMCGGVLPRRIDQIVPSI